MDPLSALFGSLGLSSSSSASATSGSQLSESNPFINNNSFYVGSDSGSSTGGDIGTSSADGSNTPSSTATATATATPTTSTTTGQPNGLASAPVDTTTLLYVGAGLAALVVLVLVLKHK